MSDESFPLVERPPLSFYVDKLESDDYFSFSRWGDGEWLAALGKRHPNKFNCDGHHFFPDMGRELQEILVSSPPYLMGMQSLALRVYGGDIRRFLKEKMPNQQWYYSDVFHDASLKRQLNPVFSLFKKKPLLMIGPAYLREMGKILDCQVFIDVPPKNCYSQLASTLEKAKKACKSLPKGFVCSISASMPAGIILHHLYQEFGDSAFIIDFGAVYDPYMGKKSRRYHSAVTAEIKQANLEGLT